VKFSSSYDWDNIYVGELVHAKCVADDSTNHNYLTVNIRGKGTAIPGGAHIGCTYGRAPRWTPTIETEETYEGITKTPMDNYCSTIPNDAIFNLTVEAEWKWTFLKNPPYQVGCLLYRDINRLTSAEYGTVRILKGTIFDISY